MVSMSEFLSGFSHQGQPVIQSGTIDPSQQKAASSQAAAQETTAPGGTATGNPRANPFGGPGSGFLEGLLGGSGGSLGGQQQAGGQAPNDVLGRAGLNQDDFTFGGPAAFARLLQSNEMDGGIFSSMAQNRQFGAQSSGIMGLLGSANRDRLRAASASNIDPIFAQRQNVNAGFDALSQLLGQRAQIGQQQEETRFGAQQAFTNQLEETSRAEKLFRVNTTAALHGAETEANAAIKGAKIGAKGAEKAGLYSGLGSILGGAI